jgi:hypothetical protein
VNFFSHVQLEAEQSAALDPILRSLKACPHLRRVAILTRCASADAMENLLQLQSSTELSLALETDQQWLAVADEVRRGRCNIQTLQFAMFPATASEATEAAKAIASAIRLDRNLEVIALQMENGFADEAGVALAEALPVNKTLRKIHLSIRPVFTGNPLQNLDALGAYEEFVAMLRGNTSLVLTLPPFRSAGGDQRLLESRK